MMTCIAVDDEPLAIEVIRKYASQTPLIRLENTYTDAIQALSFLRAHPVDLLILDVQMPDISGIQFIQGLKDRPMVIFTTAYTEYAVKGFDLEAVDYLVKPVRFERFLLALEKADRLREMRSLLTKKEDDGFLFIKSGYGSVRLILTEILYIEGLDDYVKIHLTGDRPPVVSQTSMKGILEKLPAGRFMRVHRSYIVSLAFVRSIRNRVIFLGEARIPVGDTYAEAITTWVSGQ